MRSVSVGRRPAITSSSSSSCGPVASARATSSRLRSGSVRVEARRWRLSNKSRRRSSSCACCRAAPTSCRCSSAPMVTLSSTVSAGNGRTIWKVRAMPRRQTASADNPSIGFPAKVIAPPSGAIVPAIMLNSVVLPAPLGPITAKIAPAGTAKLTLSTAVRPRKRLLTRSSVRSAVMACAPRRQAGARAAATPHPATPRPPAAGTRHKTPALLPAVRGRRRPSRH